ncbi:MULTISPECIES: DUF6285 domain-containing protein [Burkholderia]|uniref:DUF6285 domain-containing protein n=1 Tax=Burkholderia paludis TaxID=1506587 RepID=A0A6P2S644_9BURK|nr:MULTISPECIES: DUF6285 domain-containing protein [Burkholderia]CAB3773360.1 hypothetical protein LMG30113_07093 [Burkholderia paludis]VWC45142.1 hypothetical protein BPA30113_07236 [Burkholderia paludis]
MNHSARPLRATIEAFVLHSAGYDRVRIGALRLLSGGTIQENWSFDAASEGGPFAGTLHVELRADAPNDVAVASAANMNEQPLGYHLLVLARDILRCELMPDLPSEQRLTGLLIANAIGVTARQLQVGDRPEREVLNALERLLSVKPEKVPAPLPIDEVRARLTALNRALLRAIRDGRLRGVLPCLYTCGRSLGSVFSKAVARLPHNVSISAPTMQRFRPLPSGPAPPHARCSVKTLAVALIHYPEVAVS